MLVVILVIVAAFFALGAGLRSVTCVAEHRGEAALAKLDCDMRAAQVARAAKAAQTTQAAKSAQAAQSLGTPKETVSSVSTCPSLLSMFNAIGPLDLEYELKNTQNVLQASISLAPSGLATSTEAALAASTEAALADAATVSLSLAIGALNLFHQGGAVVLNGILVTTGKTGTLSADQKSALAQQLGPQSPSGVKMALQAALSAVGAVAAFAATLPSTANLLRQAQILAQSTQKFGTGYGTILAMLTAPCVQ